MRLRVFEASSMPAALQQMRQALGEEAMILATEEIAGRVKLTAAVDVDGHDLAALLAPAAAGPVRRVLTSCLAFHAVPADCRDRLAQAVAATAPSEPVTTLAAVLEDRYRFEPIRLPAERPLALVGPAGGGKTTAAVRLVAQALLGGLPIRVGTADTERVAGVAQLAGLLRPLGLVPDSAGDVAALRRLAASTPPGTSLVVDMPGINPFADAEPRALADLVRAAGAEPVLVLPGGMDPEDSRDLAAVYVALTAERMIVSRLDTARRLGGVLAAADLGLAFAGAGISPRIGRGLPVLSAAGLARLLLHRSVAGHAA